MSTAKPPHIQFTSIPPMGNFLTIPKAHVQAPAEDGFRTTGHGTDFTSKLMVKLDGIEHTETKN